MKKYVKWLYYITTIALCVWMFVLLCKDETPKLFYILLFVVLILGAIGRPLLFGEKPFVKRRTRDIWYTNHYCKDDE